jgi:hypothetical protein
MKKFILFLSFISMSFAIDMSWPHHPTTILFKVKTEAVSQRSSNLSLDARPALNVIMQDFALTSPAFIKPLGNASHIDDIHLILKTDVSNPDDLENAIIALQNADDIDFAEPAWLRSIHDVQMTPNDALFPNSWHHATIQSEQAWDIETGSDTVVVAIIDTGIDLDHPDLMANLWVNPGEIPGNFIDDDGNGYIDDVNGYDFSNSDANPNHDWGWDSYHSEDHGSHCAGIAAGVTNNFIGIAGASQHSKLMAVKIFPNAWDNVTANAITYAADNGADILSNSWGGGPSSSTIQAAILYARNTMGSLVLFAAGNDGSSTPHYPAANDGTLSVGATNQSDNRSWFSNYGSWVDMCAPGSSIWSCVDPENPYHNNQYEAWDGTSMATPLVAGVAALVKSRFPNLTPTELEDILKNGDDIGNVLMGARVNAFQALTGMQLSHTPVEGLVAANTDVPLEFLVYSPAPPTSVTAYYRVSGANYEAISMTSTVENIWTVTLPGQEVGNIVEYYFNVESNDGSNISYPEDGINKPFFYLVGPLAAFNQTYSDAAEADNAWQLGIPGDNATGGVWVRVDPIGTTELGVPVQPEDDHTLSGVSCYVTGNVAFNGSNSGAGDVDGGTTTLISPQIPLISGNTNIISYWRWYSNSEGSNSGDDPFQVFARFNSGTWVEIENISLSTGQWVNYQFLSTHYSTFASTVQLKFVAQDNTPGSLVEAAIDDISVMISGNGMVLTPGDVNADYTINIQDVVILVNHLLGTAVLEGLPSVAADVNQDNTTNIQDLVLLINLILG